MIEQSSWPTSISLFRKEGGVPRFSGCLEHTSIFTQLTKDTTLGEQDGSNGSLVGCNKCLWFDPPINIDTVCADQLLPTWKIKKLVSCYYYFCGSNITAPSNTGFMDNINITLQSHIQAK